MCNWIKYSTVAVAAIIATSVSAQETKAPKSEKTEEIIIRKKGDKSEKMTIIVDGESITVNGKPVAEYKDGNVTIYKKDRPIIHSSPRAFSFSAPNIEIDEINPNLPSGINKAMLGVITSRVDDGLKINEVTKESGAEKAGLKKDDVITKIGSDKISTPKELTEVIGKYKPNDKIDITYKRNGKESKTTATLGENKNKFSFRLNEDNLDFDFPGHDAPRENFRINMMRKPRIGMQIQDLEEGKGVKVQDVEEETPAAKAGLKEGDVISQINGKEVIGVDDLREQIKDLKEGDSLKVSYNRDGKTQTTDLKIPKKLKTANL